MADHARTDALDGALRTLSRAVEFPETPRLVPAVTSRLLTERAAPAARHPFPGLALWSRRRLVLVTVVGLLLLGGAAVAARLAIGAIGFEVVPSLTPSAPPENAGLFGAPLSLREARDAVSFRVGWPPSLGSPDEVYVIRPGDQTAVVVLAWRGLAGYDPIPDTPWSALMFELPSEVDIAMKTVLPGSLEPARVGGRPAYWITGPHDLGMQGAFGGQTVRVSGHVLVWERSPGVTYRLESMLSRRAAIALAETLG